MSRNSATCSAFIKGGSLSVLFSGCRPRCMYLGSVSAMLLVLKPKFAIIRPLNRIAGELLNPVQPALVVPFQYSAPYQICSAASSQLRVVLVGVFMRVVCDERISRQLDPVTCHRR